MKRPKQIVALGGGGFSMEPDNLLLDRYVVGLTGKEKPRVCFLPTASGDAQQYVFRFYRHFKKLTKKQASHLMLTPPSKPDLRAHLLSQDAIYVGGGNTINMLKIWREFGVDEILREAYEQGIVLAGISAGSICWFEWGLTDSIPGRLTPIQCLGLLEGSNCIHYDGEAERRPAFQKEIASGKMPAGYAADDGVGLHFVDGELYKVVSSRPDARAYRVEAKDHVVHETELLPDYLGGGPGTIIRRASLRDAQGIHETHHISVRELAAKDYEPRQIEAWTRSPYDQERRSQIEGQILGDLVWVIEMDGGIEGYVHLRTPMDLAPAAYLHALYVTPKAAKQGLARRLMDLAEREAQERGHPRMTLHSSKTAEGFYRKIGYEAAGPAMAHEVFGVALECLPMAKKLPLVGD